VGEEEEEDGVRRAKSASHVVNRPRESIDRVSYKE
jgi:hypothetical protein